jgi:hypothetical protein
MMVEEGQGGHRIVTSEILAVTSEILAVTSDAEKALPFDIRIPNAETWRRWTSWRATDNYLSIFSGCG